MTSVRKRRNAIHLGIAVGLGGGCATAVPYSGAPSIRPVAIVSEPPGALVVVDRDTVAVAPINIRLLRETFLGVVERIVIRALPTRAGLCAQTRIIDFDEPTPDTVAFELGRCPSEMQDWGRVFEEAEADEWPVQLSSPPLDYPYSKLVAREEGLVIVQFVIDTTGRVRPGSFEVKAANDPAFADAARLMLTGSKFAPGRLLGRKVAVRHIQHVRFRIRSKPISFRSTPSNQRLLPTGVVRHDKEA